MNKLVLIKMIFGFTLLLLLGALIIIIALGKVHQESSFGLEQLIGGLLVLAGGFAHWAFGANDEKNAD